MESLTGALQSVKRQVTQRRRSEVFDVSLSHRTTKGSLKLFIQVGEPTMVETKMHVSPDMVSEDMKNWTPDDWTKHLQEMASLIISSFPALN